MTSKEVFAKRRDGEIDEAYQMALQLMESPDPDEWDIKAFGWCLVDLIKRDSKAGQQQNLERYREQLETLNVNPDDDILTRQREYALKLCNPSGQAMQKAKSFSEKGQHQEAVGIYFQLFNDGDQSDDMQKNLGWELYRLAKQVVEQDPPNYGMAHQCLHDYFRLTLERPSNLHTCILRVADKMAKADNMQMGDFVRAWGLENLTEEDFERFIGNDGKSYPALAERVVQRASKDASGRNAVDDLKYIEPYLTDFIERFPDNIWLKYYKAKVLIALGRSDEAVSFGLEVVKNKSNDFWSWGLLGDIHEGISTDLRLACYCKALLCSKDLNFVGNVKLNLAATLIDKEEYERAKLEIDEVVNFRRSNGYRISPDVELLMAQDWYLNSDPAASNRDFYLENVKAAEELLYSELPWMNAVLGDSFSFKTKPGKLKRKLFIEYCDMPHEVVIAESKVKMFKPELGKGVKVKGEIDDNNRFQVYQVKKTDETLPTSLLRSFVDRVRVSKGMGFTEGNIFIAPPMVEEHRIADDCMVFGMAIINYNKKRSEWGWKAIRITNVDFLLEK